MGNTESSTDATQSSTTPSVTNLLTLVDWTALPAEIQQTIRMLGPLMAEGCSQSEIARRLNLPDAQVAAMRKQMGDAIVVQAYAMIDDLEPRLRQLVERLREGPRSSTATSAAGARTCSRRTGSPAGTTPRPAGAAAAR